MKPRIDALLEAAVKRGAAPNLVAIAADADGVIYEGAAGPRAAGCDEPVSADSRFRIASMTKPICAAAALQQRERGNLDFDAPVDAYCPDFAAVEVLAGFDDDGSPLMRPPMSRATVGQLLTHTAGLPYSFWNAEIARWEAAVRRVHPPGGLKDVLASPMVADPGTRFDYGVSFDWLGLVVEAASGQSLDDYLGEHVLTPLGMHSTAFQVSDEQRAECVPVHVKDHSGEWVATDIGNQQPDYRSGGHGLYSTPRDFLRFQRMLLGGGTFAGVTILQRSSVREAFTNQIGDLWVPTEWRSTNPALIDDLVVGPGRKWGWGLLLDTSAQPGLRAAGSGSWTGMFNTHFWVDRDTAITGALFTQSLPFATVDALQTYTAFERAIYRTSRGRP